MKKYIFFPNPNNIETILCEKKKKSYLAKMVLLE